MDTLNRLHKQTMTLTQVGARLCVVASLSCVSIMFAMSTMVQAQTINGTMATSVNEAARESSKVTTNTAQTADDTVNTSKNTPSYPTPQTYLQALQPKQEDAGSDTQLDTDSANVPLNAISPDTLSTFVSVIDLVRKQYIDTVSDEQLFTDAMMGMLNRLDPHAEFLDKNSYENLLAFTEGEIAQIGLQTRFDDNEKQWVVDDVAENSPAQTAGIAKGDYLHQINNHKLTDHDSEHEVTQLLSGLVGSQLSLTISNQGRRKRTLNLQRTATMDSKVTANVMGKIVVLTIPVFQTTTRQQILDVLVELKQPVWGMIIDVRNNPGGVLESAVDVAGLMQPAEQTVVKVTNKHGVQQTYTTEGNNFLQGIPTLVLQNRYSASAAEVLANSLKLSNTATIVGETSYGKGSVQSILPINDNAAIKLTVAHYQGADDKDIDGIGVIPDVQLTPPHALAALTSHTNSEHNAKPDTAELTAQTPATIVDVNNPTNFKTPITKIAGLLHNKNNKVNTNAIAQENSNQNSLTTHVNKTEQDKLTVESVFTVTPQQTDAWLDDAQTILNKQLLQATKLTYPNGVMFISSADNSTK